MLKPTLNSFMALFKCAIQTATYFIQLFNLKMKGDFESWKVFVKLKLKGINFKLYLVVAVFCLAFNSLATVLNIFGLAKQSVCKF